MLTVWRNALLKPRIPAWKSDGKEERGFTLLELMIVITIILILATIGAARYEQSIHRAREASLKQDLSAMRSAIEQYTLDKQQAPTSLDDLVTAGYLREVPMDPITRQKTWNVENSDILLSPEQTTTGIIDVHSTSDQAALDGTPYSSW
jgi:general secretion pathway protein G